LSPERRVLILAAVLLVTSVGDASAHGNRAMQGSDTLLLRMLALGRANPFSAGQRLPESVGLDIDRELFCAEPDQFERIYYDLVAGYNVFGDVGEQVSTRLYMDHLRMQSESLFLTFLPADRREGIRASWYLGATRQMDYYLEDHLHGLNHGTQVKFSGKDVKAGFLQQLLACSPAVAGPPDLLNRCTAPPCERPGASRFFFSVEAGRVPGFVAAVKNVTSIAELSLLAERFGVRRTSSTMWETSDWFQQDFRRQRPTEAGLYDLGRYGNP
jgi:hypothetical protein